MVRNRDEARIDLSTKRKVALICSGGAVKAAAFHVGVALALEHAGFVFEGGLSNTNSELGSVDPAKVINTYVGSSAGTLLTTYLASGGGLKDILATFRNDPSAQGVPGMRYWEMLSPRVQRPWDLMGWNSFLLKMLKGQMFQSPFSTAGIVRYLNQNVLKTNNFSELRSDLYVVTTELNRPRKVIFGKNRIVSDDPSYQYRNDVSIADACAASMSLPPIYHPYPIQIDGRTREFYDGEIWEPLSAHVGRDLGCDLVICSYTHQPLRIPDNRSESITDMGVESITLQAIYQSIEQKIRSARGTRKREREVVELIYKFFRKNDLSNDLCETLIAEVEERLIYKPHIDYIYIHPRPTDVEMFRAPHFSLKRKTTEEIVKKGYISGRVAMRDLYLSP
ncbi:MAG: patatin-like phospholipase family protein [Bdellovibrionota bacterium]